MKSTLDVQILAYLTSWDNYVNTVSWIGGNFAVNMKKVDNPKCNVLSLIVDADTIKMYNVF